MERSRSPSPPRPRSRSRSRSQSPPRPRSQSSRSPVKDRRMSTDEQPPKRARVDSRNEDRKRGQRLFGNLLGTLRKFQDDDKSSRKGEAAKRREQKYQRISNKLRSETSTFHEITDTERELKTLRIAAENAAYVLEHRDIALAARHAALGVAREYLHTAEGGGAAAFEATLYPAAVVPVARGPRRGAGSGGGSGGAGAGKTQTQPQALYYLPKVLLPHQEERLARQRADAAAVIADEAEALKRDKAESTREAERTRERIAQLGARLESLRDRREDVDAGEARRPSVEHERERERAGPERHDEHVRVDHDEGDMEVEY